MANNTKLKFFYANLSPAKKNSLKTTVFYLAYFLVAYLSFLVFPGGPSCGPGVNAIPMLLFPFVVGVLTIINLVRLCLSRDHLGSVIIHALVLSAFIVMVNLWFGGFISLARCSSFRRSPASINSCGTGRISNSFSNCLFCQLYSPLFSSRILKRRATKICHSFAWSRFRFWDCIG